MERESRWSDLATEVEDWFGYGTAERGWDYFEAGRVTLQEVSARCVRATVRGNRRRPYEVWIEPDPATGLPEFSCDCPAAQRGPCKHVFATLLALAEPDAGAPTPDWEHVLDEVEPAEPRDPWAGVAALCSRPAFVLSAAAARMAGTLALRVMHRRPLASGGWSAPERLRRNDGRVRWDAAGERLYRRVLRASAGAETYFDSGGVDGQLHLDPAEARDLVIELTQAGALYLASERGRPREEPATCDEGPPFEFRLNLERKDPIRLSGCFRRGERRVAIEEPELVLACGLMILDDTIVPVDYAGAWPWVVHLRNTGQLELPAEAFPALATRLSEYGHPLPLDPPLPAADAPPVAAQLRLRDELAATPNYAEYLPRHARADVVFLYGDCVVPAASPAAVGVDPRSGATMPRDLEGERALLTQLLEAGARPAGPLDEFTVRLPRIGGASIIGRLLRAGWQVEGDGHEWRQPDALSFRVTTGIDWFELEGGLQFGDRTVTLPEILHTLRSGGDVVALDDGSHGLLPDGLDERLALVTHLSKQADGKLRFRRNQGWMLDALLAEHDATLDADAGFAKLRRKVADFDRIRPRDAGRGFKGELRPYQRDALGWLHFLQSMGLGGCLADDMGLGKTVMVLAHLLSARSGTKPADRKPALVVAPKSLAWNWIDEARRFAPSLRVLDYSGPAATRDPARIPEHDLVVTTYGVLRRDAADLKDIPLGYVILDEAQAVKNPASQGWKAARLLRADHRLALTGTPVENHLGDLWAILEFLNPGILGPRATHKAWAKAGGDEAELRERVARLVRPVLLRRTKEQVLKDLPPKQETLLHCDLGPTQRRLYDELLDHYRATLLDHVDDEGMARARFHVLEALLRLRQCACHPGLLDEERAERPAAKFDTLLPLLEGVRDAGAKALVFSQFTSLLALLQGRLDAAAIPYAYLDGKTRRRDEVVRGFSDDPDTPLFLISLKAGGVGLNLTAADHVFLLDPWWNPAVERQAVDRTHRIGQTRTVNVYRLVATDTVEERILELQDRKRAVARAVVGEDAGLLRKLTRDDLAALLGA